MANHPSALKRARQNETRRLRNVSMKSRIKTKVRQFKKTLEKGTTDAAAPLLKEAASLLDRAASKGILHKRTASRKISRLAKKLHKAGGRVSAQA